MNKHDLRVIKTKKNIHNVLLDLLKKSLYLKSVLQSFVI